MKESEKFATIQGITKEVGQDQALGLANLLGQGITYTGLFGTVQALAERYGSPSEKEISRLISELFDQWDVMPDEATNPHIVLNYDLTAVPAKENTDGN